MLPSRLAAEALAVTHSFRSSPTSWLTIDVRKMTSIDRMPRATACHLSLFGSPERAKEIRRANVSLALAGHDENCPSAACSGESLNHVGLFVSRTTLAE